MKNSNCKKSPIWPYLGILACLFLLSLTAPRSWDRHTRREPVLLPSAESPRTSPNVVRVPRARLDGVVLETGDDSEFVPRDSEFGLTAPAIPSSSTAEVTELLPPAPEYAADVETEVAHLPASPELTPADAAPGETSSEIPVSPLAPDDTAEDKTAIPPPEDEAPAIATRWPLPRNLIEQLTNLTHEDGQLVWTRRSMQLVQDFCREQDLARAHDLLAELRQVATRDARMPAADPALQPQVGRMRYALSRWIDVWEAAIELDRLPLAERVGQPSTALLKARLDDFESLARRHPAGSGWREFLELDELRRATAEGASAADLRQASRAVLDRLSSPRLSPAQREFARQGPLAALRDELQSCAAEPVDVEELLAHLEQFEYTGQSSDAQLVAEDYRNLIWSQRDQAVALGRHLDTHYRNANVRVAVSGELVNRAVPQPRRINAAVRDTVVNVPVRGNSSTFTELSIRLVPDGKRLRMGLEAQGTVDANTVSSSGPATFRNRGQSTFLVRKLFVIGPRGLHVWPAIAEAENSYNYLVSLETDFDGVPLVGSLVRNIARGQYDEMRDQTRRHTEQKVAVRALHQLDDEVDTRLAEVERKMKQTHGAVLDRLGLELAPISLSTTEERLTARVRLAGPEQLGAHTPRPRAPSDSWLSLQLHQSALNNGLEKLELEGRSFELPELFDWIAKKLGRPELAEQEDLPENVRVKFADRDAVRLTCVDDRIEVTFSLAELTHEGSRWRNFQVRTHYAPEAEGLSPRFSRVDTIHLDGESMRGKIEFKLRAIFSKVLSKNRDLRLLADSVTGDPRFKDLQMTQFDVEDGWIALAYSPRRVSSKVARRRK